MFEPIPDGTGTRLVVALFAGAGAATRAVGALLIRKGVVVEVAAFRVCKGDGRGLGVRAGEGAGPDADDSNSFALSLTLGPRETSKLALRGVIEYRSSSCLLSIAGERERSRASSRVWVRV